MITINQPQLTPEQIELIPVYRSKWQKVALNEEPINKEATRLAINNAYDFLELNEPQIIFLRTPNDALEYVDREIANSWGNLNNSSLGKPVAGQLIQSLLDNLNSQIKGGIYENLQGNLDNGLADRLTQQIADRFPYYQIFNLIWAHSNSLMLSSAVNSQPDEITKAFFDLFFSAGFIFSRYVALPFWEYQNQITEFLGGTISSSSPENNFTQMYEILFTSKFPQQNGKYQLPQIGLSSYTVNLLIPSVMADYAYYIDYLHEVLNCERDEIKWNIFQDLITNCGWIFPYKNIVLVSDR